MRKTTTSERLKCLMSERQLRQIDILNLCKPYCEKYNVKVDKNHISQYINGKAEPRQDKLSILAMALDVDEAWLIGFDVPMKKHPIPLHQNLTVIPLFAFPSSVMSPQVFRY